MNINNNKHKTIPVNDRCCGMNKKIEKSGNFKRTQTNRKSCKKKQYLVADGNGETAIGGAATSNTVDSPRAGDGYKRSIKITINFHFNSVHLKRNECRRITPTVHVRLIASYVRIINDPRIVDHRVNHWSFRKK